MSLKETIRKQITEATKQRADVKKNILKVIIGEVDTLESRANPNLGLTHPAALADVEIYKIIKKTLQGVEEMLALQAAQGLLADLADAVAQLEHGVAVRVLDDNRVPQSREPAREHLARIPYIVLDPKETPTVRHAAVAFTTATYGINTAGTVYRMDDVPIPLRPAFASPFPSDEDVLRRIERRIMEGRGKE